MVVRVNYGGAWPPEIAAEPSIDGSGDRFEVHVYEVVAWSGEPAGMEGQPVRWSTPRAISSLPCTPSTRVALAC